MAYAFSGYPHDLRNAKQMAKKRICIGKMDLDGAYLRIHANATTALTCIEIVEKLACLYMRLPFGTTRATIEYMTTGKAEIGLGKNLPRYEYWDTENLNSPHRYSLPKEDKQQSKNHLWNIGYPISGHHIHRSINGWVHWQHHHHNSQWQKLDRTRKKYGSIVH